MKKAKRVFPADAHSCMRQTVRSDQPVLYSRVVPDVVTSNTNGAFIPMTMSSGRKPTWTSLWHRSICVTVLHIQYWFKLNATASQPQRTVLKYFAIFKNVAHSFGAWWDAEYLGVSRGSKLCTTFLNFVKHDEIMSKNQLTGSATQPQRNRKLCQFNNDQYCKQVTRPIFGILVVVRLTVILVHVKTSQLRSSQRQYIIKTIKHFLKWSPTFDKVNLA